MSMSSPAHHPIGLSRSTAAPPAPPTDRRRRLPAPRPRRPVALMVAGALAALSLSACHVGVTTHASPGGIKVIHPPTTPK